MQQYKMSASSPIATRAMRFKYCAFRNVDHIYIYVIEMKFQDSLLLQQFQEQVQLQTQQQFQEQVQLQTQQCHHKVSCISGSNIKISNPWIRISEGWIIDQNFKNG